MSVLIYIDQSAGKAKKSSLEAAYYGASVAKQLGVAATAIVAGEMDASELSGLGNFGVNKVLHVNDAAFNNFDSKAFAQVIAEAADKEGASVVVVALNQNGMSVAPRLSVRMKAGYVPGASSLPTDDFQLKKTVFSGKATAHYAFNTDKKIIGLTPNTLPPVKTDSSATVEGFATTIGAGNFGTTVSSVQTIDGEIPLTEAELVVSAGRGLRGPENWGIIEELAKELGAATACSRPVSDIGWRPHHEHVGQTGVTVRPNLYIAVGISGAIQHLAGVNQSKVMVVVNTDAEAPFFKAADYGVVGDAFDVVPKLTAAIKKLKAENH